MSGAPVHILLFAYSKDLREMFRLAASQADMGCVAIHPDRLQMIRVFDPRFVKLHKDLTDGQ